MYISGVIPKSVASAPVAVPAVAVPPASAHAPAVRTKNAAMMPIATVSFPSGFAA